MLIGQAVILGIIQGIAEFLPISSSGHLIIIPALFQWDDQGVLFDAVLHLGTLTAVIIYFRSEIRLLTLAWLRPKSVAEYKKWRLLGMYLVLATLPAVFFGMLFEESISSVLRNTTVVALSLIVWAIVLLVAEMYGTKYARHKKDITSISALSAWTIGLWQVLALIPGTSRSGITIIGGLFARLEKQVAIKFSFLLSIPVIAGAGLLSLLELVASPDSTIGFTPLIAGFLAAAGSGYLAILLLINLVKQIGFLPFVVYRIILAVGLLLFL